MFLSNSNYHKFGGLGINSQSIVIEQNDQTVTLSGQSPNTTFYRLGNPRGYTNAVFNCELTPATDDTFYVMGDVTISGNGNTINGSASLSNIGSQKVTEFKYNGVEWVTREIPYSVFLLGDGIPNNITTEGTNISTDTSITKGVTMSPSTSGYTSTGRLILTADSFYEPSATIIGLAMNNDGTKMYYKRQAISQIDEYTLSTPYDVSTATSPASYVTSYPNVTGMIVANNGEKLYLYDTTGTSFREFTFDTPYDITSLNETGSFASPDVNSIGGFDFSIDGRILYVLGFDDVVYAYKLGIPWQLGSANSTAFQTLDVSPIATINPIDIRFNKNGDYMYICDAYVVRSYKLATAWDITTHTSIGSQSHAYGMDYPAISDDGTHAFFVTASNDIRGFTIDTSYNVPADNAIVISGSTNQEFVRFVNVVDTVATISGDGLATDFITSYTNDTDLTLSGQGTGIVVVDDDLSVTNGLTIGNVTGGTGVGGIYSVHDRATTGASAGQYPLNFYHYNDQTGTPTTDRCEVLVNTSVNAGNTYLYWALESLESGQTAGINSFLSSGNTYIELYTGHAGDDLAWVVRPTVADGASSIAYKFGCDNLLDTAGAKIATFTHDMLGTEKEVMSIHDGGVDVTGTLTVDTIDDSGAGYITIRGNRVLIGDSATSSAIESIAIGVSSSVGSGFDYGIAVGSLAQAGEQCISIGYNTGASGDIENFGARTIAIGYEAQKANQGLSNPGLDRIAIGTSSLAQGGHGNDIAIGRETLYGHASNLGNHRGNKFNIAIGYQAQAAMSFSTVRTQDRCVAIGYQAMTDSTTTPYTGFSNIAIGDSAGQDLSTDYNISIGSSSNGDGAQAIAIGRSASATATNATAIGYGASSTNTNSVAIGLNATTSADNTMFVGGTTPMNLVASGNITATGDIFTNRLDADGGLGASLEIDCANTGSIDIGYTGSSGFGFLNIGNSTNGGTCPISIGTSGSADSAINIGRAGMTNNIQLAYNVDVTGVLDVTGTIKSNDNISMLKTANADALLHIQTTAPSYDAVIRATSSSAQSMLELYKQSVGGTGVLSEIYSYGYNSSGIPTVYGQIRTNVTVGTAASETSNMGVYVQNSGSLVNTLDITGTGIDVTGTYSVNGNVGVSGTGTTITAITVENGIITAITVS
jgi:hypothetical protein